MPKKRRKRLTLRPMPHLSPSLWHTALLLEGGLIVQSGGYWIGGLAFLCLSMGAFEGWFPLLILGGGLLLAVSVVVTALPWLATRLHEPELASGAPRGEVSDLRAVPPSFIPYAFRGQGYHLFHANVRFRRPVRNARGKDLVLRQVRLLVHRGRLPHSPECRVCVLRTPGDPPIVVLLGN